jgi:hypothetical protein
MPEKPAAGPAPASSATGSTAPPAAPPASTAPATSTSPAVMTTLICEQCGNEHLIRVKGCWYCEKCHYKFDCYGW